MSIYKKIDNYTYENIPFYYQLNDKKYFTPWGKPTDKKLSQLLEYFKHNFQKSNLYNIYLTGRFNSNQKQQTWDIDLLLTYKDIKSKNYEDIYNCLFFLKDIALDKYHLLVDIIYIDNIYKKNDFPKDILKLNTEESEKYVLNNRNNENENIMIYHTIIKKSNTHNFCYKINKDNVNEVKYNEKILFIIKYDNLSFKDMIKKKIQYIKNDCHYYDTKLIYAGGEGSPPSPEPPTIS